MAEFVRGLTARIIREGAGEDSVFIAEHNFYCYVLSPGNPSAVLRVVLQKVAKEIGSDTYSSGADFEAAVLDAFDAAGMPGGVQAACVFNHKNKLFLLTRETGEIYIQRGGKTMKLLSGNKFAVGGLQDEDTFLLSTKTSSQVIEDKGGWSAYLEGADMSGHDLSGLILTASVVEKEEDRPTRRAEAAQTSKKPREPLAIVEKLKSLKTMDRKRLIMFGGLGFIGLLLIVSLVFGLIRRANDKKMKQIAYTKQEVQQKLQQAEDVAFLNSGRAAGLINDAKQDIGELKQQLGTDDSKEIKELNDMVAKTEAAIFKKEEKQPEEFFDLAIEDKSAKGKLIARSEDRAAIVDPSGNVYLLNLEKKSLEKVSSGVKNAIAVALGDASVFVAGSNGIVQIDEDGKAKKVLDKDWNELTSMAVFNNNIYILDGSKGIINKYTPTDKGYGGKSSYIKGNGPNLNGAKSIAIDSSVYVVSGDAVYKFTSGLQDGFAPQFPEGGLSITKIDSAEDVEKVFVWDKPRGLLFILSKNGSYERQIKSPALKSADDLVVTKDFAYLLEGQKIYKISTD